MNLDEAQKKTVSKWITEGLKLSDIQKRLSSELGLNLTYMEVRFLVDDLKLTPKDAERSKPADLKGSAASGIAGPGAAPNGPSPLQPDAPNPMGGVSVTVDQISRPGTVVSGKVVFSDGMSAEWHLDQTGRLGLSAKQQGYRPSPEDLADFQAELQTELAKLGF